MDSEKNWDGDGAIAVAFLLTPNFPMMAYASAMEPLRASNTLAGRPLYRWTHVSADGAPVRASNGVLLSCDTSVRESAQPGRAFVIAGGNPAAYNDAGCLRWLRRLARGGVPVGGVSGGPYILARAGLLAGYRFTIHWEHIPALAEAFPDLAPSQSLYVIDRDRMTCAGGISALDMMHELIERDHGPALAASVSEWFLHTEIRLGSGPQRLDLRERLGVKNPAVLRALRHIEANLEDPVSRADMAIAAGVSVRQLDRLFEVHLGKTVRSAYLEARLERARLLLRQTAMPVLDVAVATGFGGAPQFSRDYARRFGHPPRRERL